MKKIRVLVADDHTLFREGVCRLLADEADIEVVAKAADGQEVVTLAKETEPDVAVIDVAMPVLNGIEAASEIKKSCPHTAVIMISAFDYESYVLASLRAGAAGYLLKAAALRQLVNAIRMVHEGQAVFDFRATGNILSRTSARTGEEKASPQELLNRELQVLKLTAQGFSNKRIAADLGISEATVQTHLVKIFRKLGVGSRTEAVLRAFKRGWLTLDDLP